MNGPRDYHTKQSKSDKQHIISFICGIYKNNTNELMYKTETGSQTSKTSLWLSKRKRVLDEGGIN